jgi:hypothetical protein
MLSVEVAKGVTGRGVFVSLKCTREATDPQGSGRAESPSQRTFCSIRKLSRPVSPPVEDRRLPSDSERFEEAVRPPITAKLSGKQQRVRWTNHVTCSCGLSNVAPRTSKVSRAFLKNITHLTTAQPRSTAGRCSARCANISVNKSRPVALANRPAAQWGSQ